MIETSPDHQQPESVLKRHALWLILLLATALRLGYLITYSHLPDWNFLTVDNWYHLNWAQSIADGNLFGDTTYFRAPLYVYCLAALRAVAGSSLWVPRLFGLVIGLLSVYTTYRIGNKLFGRQAGLWAALLHALYPIAIYFESELLLDPLFTLLFELVVYRLLIWFDNTTPRQSLWLGLVIGLAAICRPTALVVVPIALVVWLLRKPLRWKQLAMLFAGMVVVIGPITVRNLAVADDPVLIASQSGINLYIGNNDVADGYSATMPEPYGRNWQISQITYAAEKAKGKTLKPGEVSTYWTSQAIDWITKNPGNFIALYAKKVYAHFLNREISNNRNLHVFFGKVPLLHYNPITFGILIALSIIGLVSLGRWPGRMWLIIAVLIVYVSATSLFFFNSRFRLPIVPILFVMSGMGLTWLFSAAKEHREHLTRLLVPITCGIVGALVSFMPLSSLPAGSSADSLVTEGLARFARGDFAEARDTFAKALAIAPDDPEIRLNLGASWLRLREIDSARTYFIAEMNKFPQRTKVYENIATMAFLDLNIVPAREYINLALKREPYRPVARQIQVRIMAADPHFSNEVLVDTITAALRAVDDSLPVLLEGAVRLIERGDTAQAEQLLLSASAAQPPPVETDDQAFGPASTHTRKAYDREKANAWYLLGYLNGVQGNIEPAIEYSRKAIEARPELVEAYANLTMGLLTAGRLQEADSVLSVAVTRFPSDQRIRDLLNMRKSNP